jgi:hypothetical protein
MSKFLGILTVPSGFSPEERIEYGPLYHVEIAPPEWLPGADKASSLSAFFYPNATMSYMGRAAYEQFEIAEAISAGRRVTLWVRSVLNPLPMKHPMRIDPISVIARDDFPPDFIWISSDALAESFHFTHWSPGKFFGPLSAPHIIPFEAQYRFVASGRIDDCQVWQQH